jgi:hypothetical protein
LVKEAVVVRIIRIIKDHPREIHQRRGHSQASAGERVEQRISRAVDVEVAEA